MSVLVAHSAVTGEYTDYISVVGKTPQMSDLVAQSAVPGEYTDCISA